MSESGIAVRYLSFNASSYSSGESLVEGPDVHNVNPSHPLSAKKICALACSIALIVGGIFFLLASAGVLPKGVNAITTLGPGGYAIGALSILSGILIGIYNLRSSQSIEAVNTSPSIELESRGQINKERTYKSCFNAEFFAMAREKLFMSVEIRSKINWKKMKNPETFLMSFAKTKLISKRMLHSLSTGNKNSTSTR